MNTDELLRLRERAIDAVRRFFKAEGFTEVETPLLVPSPGVEPHLDPFEVRAVPLRYLPTSPEYAMKKLLAAGSGSIFQVARAFRDEPPSAHHLPEFTMLEWYRVGADYRAAMEDCERLCSFVAEAVCGSSSVLWQGSPLDLSPPYERLSVREAFRRYAGVGMSFTEPLETLMEIAKAAEATDIVEDDDWDEVFWKLFLRFVEPRIGRERPAFLYDYPARMASLARIKRTDSSVCERFELYAGGLELANAFSELTDAASARQAGAADRRGAARGAATRAAGMRGRCARLRSAAHAACRRVGHPRRRRVCASCHHITISEKNSCKLRKLCLTAQRRHL